MKNAERMKLKMMTREKKKKTTFSSLESKHEKNVTLKFYIKLFRNVLLFDELPFLGGVFNELASGGRAKKKNKYTKVNHTNSVLNWVQTKHPSEYIQIAK